MIAYLTGQVFQKNIKSIILLTSQQVGYEVFVSAADLERLRVGELTELYIHTYVKEDALDLYGFATVGHLDLFRKLLSVSGVGPKSAINIIGLAEIIELKKAITSGDASLLQQVAGIGKKTAERIVVELKEKLITDFAGQPGLNPDDNQVVAALVSLGYRERDAREATREIKVEGDLSVRVKAALNVINHISNAG